MTDPFDLEWMKGRLRFIESDCARHMLQDCIAEIERLREEQNGAVKTCYWTVPTGVVICPLHGKPISECPAVTCTSKLATSIPEKARARTT